MRKVILIIVCALLVMAALSVGGCDVQKKSIKASNEQSSVNSVKEEKVKKTFNYGTINTEDATVDYIPADPTKLMSVVNSKGDTIISKNAKISYGKKKVVEQKNENSEETYSKQEEAMQLLIERIEQSEKEKSFQTKAIIYGFIGLALFVVIVGGAFLYFVNSKIKVLTKVLESRIV